MKTSLSRPAALILASALALGPVAPSYASTLSDEVENEWTQSPQPMPGPGGPDDADTAEGGFSKPDNENFGENLQDRILRRLCTQIHVRGGVGIVNSGGFTVDIKPDRYFKAYANGRYAIIDDHGLSSSYTKSWFKDLANSSLKFGVVGGVASDNRSIVVRPLPETPDCGDLKRLLDPRDVKLAVPVSLDLVEQDGGRALAERIKKMQEGEVWKISLKLAVTGGLGAQAGEIDAAKADWMIIFTDSRTKGGAATMSLRRLKDNKLRFRFRADHANIRSRTLGVNLQLAGLREAEAASGVIAKAWNKKEASEINELLRAWFTFGNTTMDGDKLVFEFVLDLEKEGDAEIMAQTMRGNFLRLIGLGVQMATFQVDEKRTREVYDEFLSSMADKTARKATWAAGDKYRSRSVRPWAQRGYNVLAFSGAVAKNLTESRIDRRDGSNEAMDIFCGEMSAQYDHFKVPLVGPMVREKSEKKNCAVVLDLDKNDPKPQDPFMAYIRNEGFEGIAGVPTSLVKSAMDEYNDVLRLAGAQRGSRRGRVVLDDSFVPAPSYRVISGGDAGDVKAEESNRTGTLSLTLVLNQQAVRDGFSITGKQLLAAVPAVVEPTVKPVAEWLARNGWTEGTTVLFNERSAREAMREMGMPGDLDAYQLLTELSRTVGHVLADFVRVGGADGPVERARRISEMVGGDSKSDWDYDRMLSLIIQFVEPSDITAKFQARVRSSRLSQGKKENVEVSRDLKRDRAEVPGLKEAGAARERFAEPSVLRD